MDFEIDLTRFAALRDEADRLMVQGQAERAAQLHAEAWEMAPGEFSMWLQRSRLGIRLQDMPAARAAFHSAMDAAQSFSDLHTLFQFNPEVFDFWERISIWLRLQPRILAFAEGGPNAIDARMLAARLKLALRDYDGFLVQLDRMPPIPNHPIYELLWKTAAFLHRRRFPDFEAPKIFGIGLSKTGTTSLTAALTQLGFHTMHFINGLTCEVLRSEDAFLCDAMTDNPVCIAFETLYHMFPNSKFVYTTRGPKNWEPSFTGHYRRNYRSSGFDDIKTQLFTRGGATRGQERAPIHGSLLSPYDDAIAAYRAFDSRVRRFFSQNDAGRLLEMDIEAGDGWATLCPFLGRPIPAIAFPWRNKSVGRAAMAGS